MTGSVRFMHDSDHKKRALIACKNNKCPNSLNMAFIAIKIFQSVFKLQSGHEIKQSDNSKSKKARDVNLVCDTSSHPDLHFYQVSSKYSKGYSSYSR